MLTTLAMVGPGVAFARQRRARSATAAAKSAEPNKLAEPYAAALLMEPISGTVIFENNEHKPWPTASLAKMMIAMIVAEKLADGSLKLSDKIATSRNAADMGGSQVYLKEGETFSLDDMMKAIMVHSANDASTAVAEYVGGSTEAFVQMMNREAARLGMKDTHYYSVHGLPPGPGSSRTFRARGTRPFWRARSPGTRRSCNGRRSIRRRFAEAPSRFATLTISCARSPDVTGSKPDSTTRPVSMWWRRRIGTGCV